VIVSINNDLWENETSLVNVLEGIEIIFIFVNLDANKIFIFCEKKDFARKAAADVWNFWNHQVLLPSLVIFPTP
jgi:hypothetical protein